MIVEFHSILVGPQCVWKGKGPVGLDTRSVGLSVSGAAEAPVVTRQRVKYIRNVVQLSGSGPHPCKA